MRLTSKIVQLAKQAYEQNLIIITVVSFLHWCQNSIFK